MSINNALRTGWLPHVSNPRIDTCNQIFDRTIREQLLPKLKRITALTVSHPHFNSQYTKIRLHFGPTPRHFTFHFHFDDRLVDDILCTPDAIEALTNGNISPLQLLDDLRDQAHTLDAWTRGHIHYIHTTLDNARLAYSHCMDTVMQLNYYPEAREESLAATLIGAPPSSQAQRPTFDIVFQSTVYEGWYTCPKCDGLAPDHPNQHSSSGIPLCPSCDKHVLHEQTMLK